MYYFVKVPMLPTEASHQSGGVKIVEYIVKEKERVERGQIIAVVENWWVRMALKAVGSGYISKIFFEPHAHVRINDPFAIVVCDPEDAPHGEATCTLEIMATIRQKPGK
jgi:pyruvate/2-oxoglutarate dehydrogenase complex dihydrolipoamide acyltransferase (E2) component